MKKKLLLIWTLFIGLCAVSMGFETQDTLVWITSVVGVLAVYGLGVIFIDESTISKLSDELE